ncbi:acyltransferase [Deefgea sp. CFH1-16]|uniref:acyltransferase family protein n=1 Tax=Deefgea sp. CFH1-16 TaxID=2675457 RepID=UPI0015F49C96|nr:acyltransferase [Deefgea sp. CFH1-16]MBM5574628.1 hypothetical protein [Deefgea sp. CFH1-16]
MTHPSPRHKHRFIVLDSFRGLCALSVVVFHLHLWQGFSEWDFFRSAGLMVEFFFTLSGFVLAYRYQQEAMNGRGFARYMVSRFFSDLSAASGDVAAVYRVAVAASGP